MISRRILFASIISASISTIAFSQTKVPKTDVNRDIDVVRVYEQVVQEGYGTAFIYKELAKAYYFRSEYRKALPWFQKLFSLDKDIDPELAQQYKQSIKAVTLENSQNINGAVAL